MKFNIRGLGNAMSVPNYYLNQCRLIVIWILRNRFQWNLNDSTNNLIVTDPFEVVVCKISAILFWPHCVKHGAYDAVHVYFCWWKTLNIKMIQDSRSFYGEFVQSIHTTCLICLFSINTTKGRWNHLWFIYHVFHLSNFRNVLWALWTVVSKTNIHLYPF